MVGERGREDELLRVKEPEIQSENKYFFFSLPTHDFMPAFNAFYDQTRARNSLRHDVISFPPSSPDPEYLI